MATASKKLYDSIQEYDDLNRLLEESETESNYLECKAHTSPKVNHDTKIHLAKGISGFSNSEGGVYMIGVDAPNHPQSDADVLTEIVPIANVDLYAKRISNVVPQFTTRADFDSIEYKTIKKDKEKRGVLLIHVPSTKSDPVQSLLDQKFYFRSGDKFVYAPFEVIKRLFAASESPDLHLDLSDQDIEYKDPNYEIPIVVMNYSSAIGENCVVQIEVLEYSKYIKVASKGLHDVSHINKGKRIYTSSLTEVVHKGLGINIGSLIVQMGNKKKFQFQITIFANKMVSRVVDITCSLMKKKCTILSVNEKLNL